MGKTLRVYFAYFTQFLKTRLEYRADFIAAVFANVLTTLGGILFVLILIDGKVIQSLRGWTRDEVLFIYGYSMVSMAVFSTVAPNLYSFSDRYIIQGQFDRVLLRPLNSLCQVIFESFNLEAIGSMMVGIGLLIYSGTKLGLTFSLLDALWVMVSGFSGGVIIMSVFIFLSSLSFHFEDRLGIAPPFYNLINFSRYPLPIFGDSIQFILKWVVPFSFVAFFPATHFLGRPEFLFLCYFTPVMAVICLTVAGIAWKIGVAKYASTGN